MRVFAPGKAVVLGEYAVLDGAPAIVAAVPQGVVCEVSPADALLIETPHGDDRFVRAALLAAEAPLARYAFSDAAPLTGARKPGLGGSAAATVAAVRAADLAAHRARTDDDTFDLARRVHHAVQGSGSGIDVAASTYGGFTRFSRTHRPAPAPAAPFLLVDSGTSAQTGPRVARYLAWPDRAAFIADSTAAVDAFAAQPIPAMRAAADALARMARAAEVDWSTPAHEAIRALALAHGGAAKPSGAGGGDVAIALLPDPDAERAFAAAAEALGFLVLVRAGC